MTESLDLKTLIRNYLDSNHVMQLATVADSKAQICSVHFAFDADFTFYWSSSRFSHHSMAIGENNQAAIGILHSEKLIQCIHADGRACDATGEEAISAHKIYSQRYGENPERLKKILSKGEITAPYYTLKPNKIVLIDAISFPNQPRQEYLLS